MLMLIKGGSSFLLYEERWVFDKEFLPRFLSFSLLFSHSFLCYLSGRRNPGLHFLGWIWLSFIRTGYEIVAGVKWLNYPFFPFLFLLLLLLLLFFFFFFNLCWRRWNFVICVPIPFYEICPSGNMKKYAKVSHGQWAAFNLVFEIENDRWNKIWFLRVRLWFNILLST